MNFDFRENVLAMEVGRFTFFAPVIDCTSATRSKICSELVDGDGCGRLRQLTLIESGKGYGYFLSGSGDGGGKSYPISSGFGMNFEYFNYYTGYAEI